MCTILTVSSEFFSRALEQRILMDGENNSDGFSLLLVSDDGAHTIIRTMDVQTALMVLRSADWSRMLLHSRYATQGSVGLVNTHGWEATGVFYFHNGCLSAPEAQSLPVDSQAIGVWLAQAGVDYALQRLATETFANVFLVDVTTGLYTVSRSLSGSLYSDGHGNFSTQPFGTVCEPVSVGFQKFEFCEVYEEPVYTPQIWDIDTVDDMRLARSRWDQLDLNDWDIDGDGLSDYVSPSLRRRA